LNDVERSISRVKLDPGAEIITPVDRGGEGEMEGKGRRRCGVWRMGEMMRVT
jgi:hypothetical protein